MIKITPEALETAQIWAKDTQLRHYLIADATVHGGIAILNPEEAGQENRADCLAIVMPQKPEPKRHELEAEIFRLQSIISAQSNQISVAQKQANNYRWRIADLEHTSNTQTTAYLEQKSDLESARTVAHAYEKAYEMVQDFLETSGEEFTIQGYDSTAFSSEDRRLVLERARKLVVDL